MLTAHLWLSRNCHSAHCNNIVVYMSIGRSCTEHNHRLDVCIENGFDIYPPRSLILETSINNKTLLSFFTLRSNEYYLECILWNRQLLLQDNHILNCHTVHLSYHHSHRVLRNWILELFTNMLCQ